MSESSQQISPNQIVSSIIDTFAATTLGQQVESAVAKNWIQQKLSDPIVLIALGLIVFVIIYPYFKKG